MTSLGLPPAFSFTIYTMFSFYLSISNSSHVAREELRGEYWCRLKQKEHL